MSKYKPPGSTLGLRVEVRNDDVTRALRQWSKKVQDEGKLKEVKDRMAYEKPTTERKRMKAQARKRWVKEVQLLIENGKWHKDQKY